MNSLINKSSNNLIVLLFGITILAFWGACSSSSNPNPASTTPPITSFTIANPTVTLVLGTDFDLSTLAITTTPEGAVTGNLTWTIPTTTTGYTIAPGTSILSSVADTITTVTVTVQASTQGTNPKTAIKEITFPEPAVASISLARNTGTGNVTITAGDKIDLSSTYTVTFTPAIANIGTLRWEVVSKTGSLATATISDKMLTAGITAGDITLTVISGTGDAAKTDTIDITITVQVEGVTVTSTGPILIGADYTLTATVAPTTALQSVSWNITTSPEPEGVSIENGVLKTVAGTVVAGTISITATSTADGTRTGTKVTSAAVDIMLNHALSLERKADQEETKVYVSGDPIDLNIVFSITPATPTGTLTWFLAQTGSLATILDSTGMITAVAAGEVQVSVTETSGGITKSSNSMPFTVNAALSNPVTDIDLINKEFIKSTKHDHYVEISAKITYADGNSKTILARIALDWHYMIIENPTGCNEVNASSGYVGFAGCSYGYFKIRVTTTELDKNGKIITKVNSLLFAPKVLVSSTGSTNIGTPLTLTATVGGTATTTGLTWAIKGTAPTGVSIGGTSKNELITTSATQAGTVTVIASYVVPDVAPPYTLTAEKEITLSQN